RVRAPCVRGPRARRGVPRGHAGGGAGRAHRHRIQAAALPDAQPAAGDDARADPRPRVELRLRGRRTGAGDVHQLPAQEARRARPLPDPHGPRRGLRPPGAAALMASLRTRLLAGVLVLAAGGLVLLAAVTYAEQRSFLERRVDDEARAAVPALSRA